MNLLGIKGVTGDQSLDSAFNAAVNDLFHPLQHMKSQIKSKLV